MKRITQTITLVKSDITIEITMTRDGDRGEYAIKKIIRLKDKTVERTTIDIFDLHMAIAKVIEMLSYYINNSYAVAQYDIQVE